MARKQMVHGLPDLCTLHPEFHGFASHENKSALILSKLRHVITRVRGEEPTTFYPMRTVGTFFGLSMRSVHQVYERLEAEGLLTRLRGSRTVVQGRKPQPRNPVRGVVGIPVYLPSFVYGTEVRSFLISLEAELRRSHFVADFIFYRAEEELDSHDLAERLLQHHLDLLLWISPPAHITPALQRLDDGGIPIVLVSDGKTRYPQQQYYFNREHALDECFTGWQQEGIRAVTILRKNVSEGKQAFEVVKDRARQRGMDCTALELSDADVLPQLQACLRRPVTGVALIQHQWYDQLCDRFPQLMERLFRSRRVLLVQGAPVHGYFRGRTVLADVITIDPIQMAKRIARDISDGKVATRERLATFYAAWQARTNLGQLTHDI